MAFDSPAPEAQVALCHDLVTFQTVHNLAPAPDVTEVVAKYLEISANKKLKPFLPQFGK